MLAPLAGQPLLLCQSASSANACSQQQQQQQQQQQLESCIISVPAQVTLLPGSTARQAAAQLAAAGIGLPALLKPLSSMPSDAAAVGSAAAAAAAAASRCSADSQVPNATAAAAAAAKAAVADGHALGVLLEGSGLQQLLDGAVPELAPPVVVQQFVPHGEALYKLYVIGPHIVLTRRSTLTLQHIQQAAAAATAAADGSGTDAGRPAVVLLQRVSAVPLSAAQVGQGSSSQPSSTGSMPAAAESTATAASVAEAPEQAAAMPSTAAAAAAAARLPADQQGSIFAGKAGCRDVCSGAAGTALADASVVGDAAAPPLWAMRQLAAHLRQTLQLSLFNVDIIAPEHQQQQQQHQQQQGPDDPAAPKSSSSVGDSSSSSSCCRCFLVVDVNFFPGFDKVPGAEQLFADFLASLGPSIPV
uniref:inositol-1,3,4-trisphosphate 5/6-kinase n=1 Tax=Tetradesmus obliquus TaxID=3088 RepID=A0A383VVB8_TETOB